MRQGAASRYDRLAIEEAKAKYNISDLAARWVAKPLKPVGHEMVGLCLFHHERTPSLRFNDAKGMYHCFGCAASGDIVDLVERHLGLDFLGALQWLGAAALPPVDPAERAKLCAEDNRVRLQQLADAQRFWSISQAVRVGDPVDTYLAARGITIDLPPSVRIGTLPMRQDKETGEWSDPRECMVCASMDGAGVVVGIQRVYFARNDPTLGKAAVKLSLGKIRGGGMWLSHAGEHVNMAEGPEDALSVAQMMPERTCIAAFGTALMPHVPLPPIVRTVTLCGQNDGAGREAVRAAGLALAERGLSVRESFPPEDYKDWNDLLRDKRK